LRGKKGEDGKRKVAEKKRQKAFRKKKSG